MAFSAGVGTDHVVASAIYALTISATIDRPGLDQRRAGRRRGNPGGAADESSSPVNNPVFVHLEGLPKGELDTCKSVKLDCAIVMDNRVPGGGVTLDPNLINVHRW